MLANSLTLEDEEAVQAELRELQLDAVSCIPLDICIRFDQSLEARGGNRASNYIAFGTTGSARLRRYVVSAVYI